MIDLPGTRTEHTVEKLERTYGYQLTCSCGWRRQLRTLPAYMSVDQVAEVVREADALIDTHRETP